MENVVMGNIDGSLERMAFEISGIERIIPRYDANLIYSSADAPGLLLELNGKVYPVQGEIKKDTIKPYFVVLKSGIAFNSTDYQILFSVEQLPSDIISGISVTGQKYLCKVYLNSGIAKTAEGKQALYCDSPKGVRDVSEFSADDAEQLKEVIQRMKKNEFFELLTMELSDKLKGVARELIDFRKDIQSKIEPDIVEMASIDIPEASNQLECINETLEESTMKIMDINEEQTELAGGRIKILRSFLAKMQPDGEASTYLKEAIFALNQEIDVLKMIKDRSLKMMEPLSFQDLVGQRIQRIIKLVRSMENRIEELIVSFGIKLIKHKEDPTRSYEELNRDVDKYMMGLKGPQRLGEGLNQNAIDDLLNGL
jgi:chemotaxis protein CheZ